MEQARKILSQKYQGSSEEGEEEQEEVTLAESLNLCNASTQTSQSLLYPLPKEEGEDTSHTRSRRLTLSPSAPLITTRSSLIESSDEFSLESTASVPAVKFQALDQTLRRSDQGRRLVRHESYDLAIAMDPKYSTSPSLAARESLLRETIEEYPEDENQSEGSSARRGSRSQCRLVNTLSRTFQRLNTTFGSCVRSQTESNTEDVESYGSNAGTYKSLLQEAIAQSARDLGEDLAAEGTDPARFLFTIGGSTSTDTNPFCRGDTAGYSGDVTAWFDTVGLTPNRSDNTLRTGRYTTPRFLRDALTSNYSSETFKSSGSMTIREYTGASGSSRSGLYSRRSSGATTLYPQSEASYRSGLASASPLSDVASKIDSSDETVGTSTSTSLGILSAVSSRNSSASGTLSFLARGSSERSTLTSPRHTRRMLATCKSLVQLFFKIHDAMNKMEAIYHYSIVHYQELADDHNLSRFYFYEILVRTENLKTTFFLIRQSVKEDSIDEIEEFVRDVSADLVYYFTTLEHAIENCGKIAARFRDIKELEETKIEYLETDLKRIEVIQNDSRKYRDDFLLYIKFFEEACIKYMYKVRGKEEVEKVGSSPYQALESLRESLESARPFMTRG